MTAAAAKRSIRGVNTLTQDCDYLDKLPLAEREWMNRYLAAEYDVTGPMVADVAAVASWTTNGRNRGKETGVVRGRTALNRAHWARQNDVLNVAYGRTYTFNEETNKKFFRGEDDE